MTIVRWYPFGEGTPVQDSVSRWFNEMYGHPGPDHGLTSGAWTPPVDIFSNDDRELILKAELPDMKREDINVTVENDTLTLRGEKKVDAEVKDQQFHRVERTYGTFVRSFVLPNTVDAGKVRAEYKNGVLTVWLPLREEAKPKQIQVEVAA